MRWPASGTSTYDAPGMRPASRFPVAVGIHGRLRTEVDCVIGMLGRFAVPGHVPQVHGEVGAERVGVPRPHAGRERGAVTEDHR
jgi:hypothetical protein